MRLSHRLSHFWSLFDGRLWYPLQIICHSSDIFHYLKSSCKGNFECREEKNVRKGVAMWIGGVVEG